MEAYIPEYEHTDLGKIQIAPEVIEVIAFLATSEIKGVASMSGSSFVGDIAERFGKKNLAKGVKVNVGQKEASINVSVVIEFGYRIPEIAQQIQDNVKQAIENMTGLHVSEVNIHVVGVFMPTEEKKDKNQLEEQIQRVR
ncbi:Asp23/Gls24 family envelope stress response protein [Microaerobacter geothermalis]|uniref:Asp23/Gls24 family envelope stress response protein n=1 Tax=Microaerobacter geothermalis TaxID=674972 RepID=UPI001F43F2BA|nr:Asp23/Gls24 family envelope stress response protein [Microaerobacter geothermalis]MCF6094447.1 Asp23/Gls24 family envelope stress response protein [Microaerobacter geothermalis]